MKRGLVRLGLAVLLFTAAWQGATAAGGPSPSAVPSAARARPDYFPLGQNDWWRYLFTNAFKKTGDFTLMVIDFNPSTGLYAIENRSVGFTDYYSRTGGFIFLRKRELKHGTVEFTPPRRYLADPLKVGQAWSWKGPAGDLAESSKVLSEDTVKVPAGTFRAFKVETVARIQKTSQRAPVIRDAWYANNVGMVKSVSKEGVYVSTTELLEYRLHGQP